MRKLILSVVILASMVLSANAVTYMRVHTSDGQTIKYDVENVTLVDYEEDTASTDTSKSDSTDTTAQGVTVSGKVGNYTYVDLGLESGNKWATYNVGASKPTEYGDYFAWGETSPKESYDYSNYKLSKDTCDTFTRYVIEENYGTVDSLTTLLAVDDAATANWGAGWRMPTLEEQEELIDGCDWKWTDDFDGSGVAGRVGTSKTNGNTIFLPAAGSCDGMELRSVGEFGHYWSSSLREYSSFVAYVLSFYSSNVKWGSHYRVVGYTVRAVVK